MDETAAPRLHVRRWALEKVKEDADIRTDEELAAELHISTTQLSAIKNGGHVGVAFIAAMLHRFGVPVVEGEHSLYYLKEA